MLTVAGYIIFVRENMLTSRLYFIITATAFILACVVFAFVLLKGRLQEKKRIKLMLILVIVLVTFQLLSLPTVNLFSQSFPIWPPRGTIYQMPGLSWGTSISQNDVGLLMKYYLDGKTLYASEDYPLNSHKGFIYITDEYVFVKGDYSVLSKDHVEAFYNEYQKQYHTITVRENPKLKIKAFKIHLYINDIGNTEELVLVLDKNNTWYFIPTVLYEEVFGE